MKRWNYRYGLVVSMALWLLSGCAAGTPSTPEPTATTAPPPPAASDEILVVTGEYPPYTGEDLEGGGFTTAIVEAVFAEMGQPVKIEYYPWPRCEAMVQNGEAWGTFPYTPTEERKADFLFSDDLVLGRAAWFYYGDAFDGFQYETLSDLKEYRIGGVEGYFYLESLQEAGLSVDMANDDLANFNKLRADRIDMFPANEYVGWWIIQTNLPDDVDSFHTLEQPYNVNVLSMMASQSYPDSEKWLQEFNEALARIRDKGTYQQIFEQYEMPFVALDTTTTDN